ncbi:pyrroline-5-carboxylate reductase family protein [Planctellipticum variicoloris]|uniref:pyrroline-5-carboxylate reductase family protein n=1 Tax=Planctellipticum variicoloris TaxID=3064265 RepID=UPI003013586B|nr:NAD(P)-binding domain-containing protein [Planctomycetaceae bacterium SH412]
MVASLSTEVVGIVGGGRVTRILLTGWQRAGQWPDRVRVFEPNAAAAEKLAATVAGVELVSEAAAAVGGATIVLLAIHPPQLLASVADISPHLAPQALVISLAPKVTLAQLCERLPAHVKVARLLPNAPSLLGQGYNPFACGPDWTATDRARLQQVSEVWGECPEVPEQELEAYAVLTAMGPTYFWFQWQTLEDQARSFGLPEERIRPALQRMLAGALQVYFESGLSPNDVIDLIPVRPLQEHEEVISGMFAENLAAIYRKLNP